MEGNQKYKLRHAAGKYWLLDMEQKDGTYRAPVAMNETGAMILEHYFRTKDPNAVAQILRDAYEIEFEEALTDVKDFLSQIRKQGVAI